MASREPVETLDRASYDRFRVELHDAGFSSDDGGRTWKGPVAEPLRAFTSAETMTMRINDGWPYAQPDLIVEGMQHLEHVNAGGLVCLWPTGDKSRQWTTLAGWHIRLSEWAARQAAGFFRIDETMDAHAYFADRLDAIAQMDLDSIPAGVADGERGPVHGRWRHGGGFLDLDVDRAGGQDVKGSWFYVRSPAAPPRDLEEFRRVLVTDRQRASFNDLITAAGGGRQRVAVLVWDTKHARNAMVVLVDDGGKSSPVRRRGRANVGPGDLRGRALEFAPSDPAVLRARAGDDAGMLEGYGVVVFGAGAIGSHTALLLAEAGLGKVTLVDGERLRPGNVVRHAAPNSSVGLLKVDAVKRVIEEHAPWTEVGTLPVSPWSPSRLRDLLADHDLALDATGVAGFTDQLSHLAVAEGETLVTAALYRRGAIARVCRQTADDTPIAQRSEANGYDLIPDSPDPEPVSLEPGCSAPVNEASATAVCATAALAARVALDALVGTCQRSDEIYEVFRALEAPPFDRVGSVSHP